MSRTASACSPARWAAAGRRASAAAARGSRNGAPAAAPKPVRQARLPAGPPARARLPVRDPAPAPAWGRQAPAPPRVRARAPAVAARPAPRSRGARAPTADAGSQESTAASLGAAVLFQEAVAPAAGRTAISSPPTLTFRPALLLHVPRDSTTPYTRMP